MLGEWFKKTGKRDEIFLASKFGIIMENSDFKGIDSSGEYCKRACEASLKKLGIDSIDLCESPTWLFGFAMASVFHFQN